MIDEKRIKRFIEGAKEAFKEVDDPTFTFPMNILSAYELATSIEELLKEQEPRVMTLEEVKRSAGETVWAERWGDSKTIVAQFAPYDTIDDSFYFFTIGNSVSYKVYTEDYYKDWRCWTSRPTDEQRKAVKWE